MAETCSHYNTVIVGNGPAALVLSYILHGHVPYYTDGHPDEVLNQKLSAYPNLLHLKPEAYCHIHSSLRYSNQAIPVNSLLDAVLRPHGDGDTGTSSYVEWRYEPHNILDHVVLGSADRPGGQWAISSTELNADIGTLSYAEQLSLPGYSFATHWMRTKHVPLPEFLRPSRTDVAEYFATYPDATGIADAVHCSSMVDNVSRTEDGFYIGSHKIFCQNLVLASGVFSINQSPPAFLRPLTNLSSSTEGALLIIGSGMTAADIIISTPPQRKVIHIFNWDPENRPSPLQACHPQAYPEYAGIYRQMKQSALTMLKQDQGRSSIGFKSSKKSAAKLSHLPYLTQRDWAATYEGLPNARIVYVDPQQHTSTVSHTPYYTVQIGRSASGGTIVRQITEFKYATGRRGSLSYLSRSLQHEVIPQERPLQFEFSTEYSGALPNTHLSAPASLASSRRSSVEHDFAELEQSNLISAKTLRSKVDNGNGDMEVARNIFAIGSVTGDSLVRLVFGGCCVVAGRLLSVAGKGADPQSGAALGEEDTSGSIVPISKKASQERLPSAQPQILSKNVSSQHYNSSSVVALRQHGGGSLANGHAIPDAHSSSPAILAQLESHEMETESSRRKHRTLKGLLGLHQ